MSRLKLLTRVFKVLCGLVIGVLIAGLVLILYSPSTLVDLMERVNINTSTDSLIIVAAFLVGGLIVLLGLIGSVLNAKSSRIRLRDPDK